MAKTVIITSCKGGIGKSTSAANLAATLASIGEKVLVVDCDFRMRSLDLIMGLEDRVVFDLCDVIAKRSSLEKAIIKNEKIDRLYFLASGSVRSLNITKDDFGKLVKELRTYQADGSEFDYIILDAPAADDDVIKITCPFCDEAIIVCSHMPTAIRAAECTAELLDSYKVEKQKLLINSFDVKSALAASRASITEMIDTSRTPLIGVVPYDRTLLVMQEMGELALSFPKNNNAKKAYMNVANRMIGKQIPLFSGFSGKEYKKITNI